ncbi:MAG: Na+/H+ antiporter subunit E [Bacteroidales bacterium]|nr:Na+/H+ antiporter subunit E [Bacteroidales bacterium]
MKYLIKILLKSYLVIRFVAYYIIEMIKANLLIAADILSVNPKMTPGIVRIKLDVTSDQEILSLFNLLSMTPGSLSIDVSDDKKCIYVHGWNIDDVEKFKQEIKTNLEKRVLEIFR